MGLIPGQGGVVILGEAELRRTLALLGRRGFTRVSVAGIKAGMTVFAKAIRKEVTAMKISSRSPKGSVRHSASLKRGMKKVVGARFTKKKSESERQAKAGFGVGLPKSKQKVRLSSGETTRNERMVGVTASTKHWFVLGTTTKNRHGAVPDFFKGCVPRAYATASGPAMAKAVATIRRRVPIEAIKAKRGG